LATALVRRWQLTNREEDAEAARTAYRDAVSTSMPLHLPTAFDAATQWGGWAWLRGQWGEAGEAYGHAVTALHYAVRRQAGVPDKELTLRKAPGVAAMAALGLARDGAADAAFVALETGRAVLLAEIFDNESINYAQIATSAGQSAADEYQRLTTGLMDLESGILARGRQPSEPELARMHAVRRERDALLAGLRSQPGPASDAPPSLDLDGLREAAGPVPVVHLATTTEAGLALILHPRSDAVIPVELPGLTSGAARAMAARFGKAAADRDTGACDEICRELWQLVMRRLVGPLHGFGHTVLIPGGQLSALPWHAAAAPGDHGDQVVDSLAISYAPNVRSLRAARAALAARAEARGPVRAVVVDQPAPSRLARLDTGAEIAAVLARHSDRLQVTQMPGPDATVEALLKAISRFQVVHFTGHAIMHPTDPLAGAMVMAHDRPLTIRQLMARGPGPARTAILSACHTASAGEILPDEMINFPTALLRCGFSSVVGSLWQSYDKPSAMLMDAFYQEWQCRQDSPSEALSIAQQWTRDHGYKSPLAWANFVHVGP
jgi:hypothetical protein